MKFCFGEEFEVNKIFIILHKQSFLMSNLNFQPKNFFIVQIKILFFMNYLQLLLNLKIKSKNLIHSSLVIQNINYGKKFKKKLKKKNKKKNKSNKTMKLMRIILMCLLQIPKRRHSKIRSKLLFLKKLID